MTGIYARSLDMAIRFKGIRGCLFVSHDQSHSAAARTDLSGYVAVNHAAPLAVLKRRAKGIKGAAQLFPELTPGGLDNKLSSSAVIAACRPPHTSLDEVKVWR
jgi:hypothetical protein